MSSCRRAGVSTSYSQVRDGRVQPPYRNSGSQSVIPGQMYMNTRQMTTMIMAVGTFGAAWWYVVIHNAPQEVAPRPAAVAAAAANPAPAADDEQPQELGSAASAAETAPPAGPRTALRRR